MMKISKKWPFFFILISFLIVNYFIIITTSSTFAQNNIAENSLFSSLSRNLNSTIDGIQSNTLTNNNNNTQTS
jgi:hypothetical protein